MPSTKYPNSGIYGGWNRGESGWGYEMNKNLLLTDALLHAVVKSKIKSIPATVKLGDLYLVDTTDLSTALSNKKNHLILFRSSDKTEYIDIPPLTGYKIYLLSDSKSYIYRDGAWIAAIATSLTDSDEEKAASAKLTSELNKKIGDTNVDLSNLEENFNNFKTDTNKKITDTNKRIDELEDDLIDVNNRIGTVLPIGCIMAFSGTFGGTDNRYPIPLGSTTPDTNWCLCDGTTTNGKTVPDLRGRMILGASTSHAAGTKGGSETHTHSISGTVGSGGSHSHTLSGSVSAMTLTTSQMPSHIHKGKTAATDQGAGYFTAGSDLEDVSGIATASTGGSSSHSHSDTFSVGSGGSHTHSLSNVSTTNANNLPPYYTLSYIIRIA